MEIQVYKIKDHEKLPQRMVKINSLSVCPLRLELCRKADTSLSSRESYIKIAQTLNSMCVLNSRAVSEQQ